ncbi:MAG TPA: hypothetical protein VJN48_17740 [Terriglobales bacterium]|nr:hypothetical protein [Terriglobales bacterium]
MNPDNCQRESQVVADVRAGQWSAELRAHLACCETCGEAALVAESLQAEQQIGELPALPSAGQVWWKAQIRGRREDAERALKPVQVAQRTSAACALLALCFLIVHYAPQLQQWLNHLPAVVPSTEESLAGVFFASAIAIVAALSAGLSYLLHSSK